MKNQPKLRTLNHQELKILMEIQENPFVTYEELAQKTKISKTVIFRIIKKLEDPSLKPSYFTIVAIPNLPALGLENLEVFIEAELPHELDSILTLCKEHPYIWYYARCYGKINGFIIQYRIPRGTVHQIQDLLDILKSKNLIRNYYILNFAGNVIYTHPQVKNWNLETLSWNFDWTDWFSKIGEEKEKIHENNKQGHTHIHPADFQKKDLIILRELLKNSRRKNIEMVESISKKGWNISQQTFSKKAPSIKEKFILDYRAEIHPETVDLTIPVLLWGRGDRAKIADLAWMIEKSSIPFHSTFKHHKTLLYWYLNISTLQLTDLLFNLRPILSELHYFFIDLPHSEKYSLEIPNYDEIAHDWITTDHFQIYDVLEKILKTQ